MFAQNTSGASPDLLSLSVDIPGQSFLHFNCRKIERFAEKSAKSAARARSQQRPFCHSLSQIERGSICVENSFFKLSFVLSNFVEPLNFAISEFLNGSAVQRMST